MGWAPLAISTVFIFTFQNILMRVLAVKSEEPRASSAVFNLWGALFGFLLYLYQTWPKFVFPEITVLGVSLLFITSLFYGLFERGQFYVRKAIDASSTAVLFRISPAIAFVASLFIYRESFTPGKFLGILFIVAANALLFLGSPHFKAGKNLLLGFLCAVSLGLGWAADKGTSSFWGPELYTALIWLMPIAVIVFPKISPAHLVREAALGSWKVPLAAFTNVFGYYLYIKAVSLAEATKVIPIVSSSSILTVIAGIVVLKERSDIRKKLLAGLLAFIGVLFLK